MNRSITKLCYLIFFYLFFVNNGTCQVNDAGLWMNIGIEKQFNKKISLFLAEELRMNENISEAGTIFTEVGGQYKLIKNLTVSGTYRFINKRRLDDSYSKRHRYMIDLGYKYKIHKFDIIVRERFQNQYNDIHTSPDGTVPESYLRNKITLKYGVRKRLTSYLSGEFFYQLNNPEGNEFDNLRYTAGFTYKYTRSSDFDIFYMINKEINIKNPTTSYIIGLGYNISF